VSDPIFHIAEEAHWYEAAAVGAYTWSTKGKSLDDEGFIHCSFEDQVAEIGRLVYGSATEPLVLLTIDPSRVEHEIKVERGYPHIYGPLHTDAVIRVEPFHA
jgi:uncharacterized protein (DUF952 family)